jgi:hypothetical protein
MTSVVRCAHCAVTVIPMADGRCPACARSCAGPVALAIAPDEPFRPPVPGAAMAPGLPDTREEWATLRERCRRDHRFAVVWTAAWAASALLSVLLVGQVLLGGFCVAALVAGAVGCIRDGRRHRRLGEHGRRMGWT